MSAASSVPEEFAEILQKNGFAHVATIAEDGSLQSNPVWFEWEGGRLRFSTTKARQKYKNLKARPVTAVSILDPDQPYRYLELRGTAEIDDDRETSEALIDRLAHKYTGQSFGERPAEERVIISIKPERVLTYP
ncbi:MAG: PPOX class F420-dependent oxidoreductase [Acidobacteria bacterium]|nr:PPOX class F420-dependent oxidoreductase [Acidobacteriota bacterium]